MDVFSELLNDLTGWLTIAVIVFMIAMMGYLFRMFINNTKKHK